MTMLGLVTFFGLAVVTVDVLGGILATTMLSRGVKPSHILFFVAGYSAVVTVATLLLKPLLEFLGRILAPVLGSETWLACIQLVIGVALIVFAIYQRRSALRPKEPAAAREIRDRIPSLIAGGALFAGTTLADPAYTVAVGMAMQTHDLMLEIVLLVAWNIVYQVPLIAVLTAGLFGAHRRVLDAFRGFFGPRRRGLLLTLALVLALGGAVVIVDGIVALASDRHSWLQSLLLLREEHA